MENIIKFLQDKKQSYTLDEIIAVAHPNKSKTTVLRLLRVLEKENKIEKIGKGKNTKYQYTQKDNYFDTPFFQRPEKKYNPSFLDSYIPNTTFFLTSGERKKLLLCNESVLLDTDFLQNNKRLYEALLIDLSYSSSYLEGNTYSYLDTEVLLKYKESAKGKDADDAQMITNHKEALDFLLQEKNNVALDKQTLLEIHTLLIKKLLPDEQLGIIRKNPVTIGGSPYLPILDEYRLRDELEIFLKKCNEIKDPFEQAFFILIFIPYFQVFYDGNKRTSRIFCNIPLIQKGLIPFSFLTVEKKDFLIGLLSVYEKNDIEPIKKVFLDSYFRSYKRYFE